MLENADETPRIGAFEVSLDNGEERTTLWSKLLTGEPSCVEASHAVAEHVVMELQRRLDRDEGGT